MPIFLYMQNQIILHIMNSKQRDYSLINNNQPQMSDKEPDNESENFRQTIQMLTKNCLKRALFNRTSFYEGHPRLDQQECTQGTKIRVSHQTIFRKISAKSQFIIHQPNSILNALTSSPDFYIFTTDQSYLNSSFSSVNQAQEQKQQEESQLIQLYEDDQSGQEEPHYDQYKGVYKEQSQSSDDQQKQTESLLLIPFSKNNQDEQKKLAKSVLLIPFSKNDSDQQQKPSESILFIPFSKDEDDIKAQKQWQEHIMKLYTPLQQHQILPWMTEEIKSIEDSNIRFHEEIISFYHYIKPSKTQKQLRMTILQHIKQVIVGIYPQAQVIPFGSFASGLYLPDGDIDVVSLIDHETLSKTQTMQLYKNIYQEFKKKHRKTYGEINFIKSARIPLIKMYHKQTNISIDISLNVCSGMQQIENVNMIKLKYPEFKYLIFVLKMMLKIRKLNQTFSGGIGSFLLSCMLYYYLRETHRMSSLMEDRETSLGDYLVRFFTFYYMNVDFYSKTINVRTGTLTGRKRRPGTISMLSPMDEIMDIGKKATKMDEILQIFKNRSHLLRQKSFAKGESLLKEIVNPSMKEFQYFEIKQKYRRYQGQQQQQGEQPCQYEKQQCINKRHQRLEENSFRNNKYQKRSSNYKNRRYRQVNRSRYRKDIQKNDKNRQKINGNDDGSSLSY